MNRKRETGTRNPLLLRKTEGVMKILRKVPICSINKDWRDKVIEGGRVEEKRCEGRWQGAAGEGMVL